MTADEFVKKMSEREMDVVNILDVNGKFLFSVNTGIILTDIMELKTGKYRSQFDDKFEDARYVDTLMAIDKRQFYVFKTTEEVEYPVRDRVTFVHTEATIRLTVPVIGEENVEGRTLTEDKFMRMLHDGRFDVLEVRKSSNDYPTSYDARSVEHDMTYLDLVNCDEADGYVSLIKALRDRKFTIDMEPRVVWGWTGTVHRNEYETSIIVANHAVGTGVASIILDA